VAGLVQSARDFLLEPRYTRAHSEDSRIDVHGITLGWRSSYRLTTWLTVFVGYAFFPAAFR